MKKEDRDWTLSFLYPEDTSEKNKKKKLKRIFCIIEKAYGYYFMKKIYSNSNIYNIDYEDFSNISNYLHENKDLYKYFLHILYISSSLYKSLFSCK